MKSLIPIAMLKSIAVSVVSLAKTFLKIKKSSKIFQKRLDKTVKMCYNNYGERERNPKPNT